MWNVTFLMEKELELLREAEKFRLDIVGLISTDSKGSGTGLLESDSPVGSSGDYCCPPARCLYIGVYPSER